MFADALKQKVEKFNLPVVQLDSPNQNGDLFATTGKEVKFDEKVLEEAKATIRLLPPKTPWMEIVYTEMLEPGEAVVLPHGQALGMSSCPICLIGEDCKTQKDPTLDDVGHEIISKHW